MATKCSSCGNRTTGSTGRCLTCKTALSRGGKAARARGFRVDEAGGSWWVWDKTGNVLVSGKDRVEALIALGKAVAAGAVSPEDFARLTETACHKCGGKGEMPNGDTCDHCWGEGTEER